jgi:hypothetical protein
MTREAPRLDRSAPSLPCLQIAGVWGVTPQRGPGTEPLAFLSAPDTSHSRTARRARCQASRRSVGWR